MGKKAVQKTWNFVKRVSRDNNIAIDICAAGVFQTREHLNGRGLQRHFIILHHLYEEEDTVVALC